MAERNKPQCDSLVFYVNGVKVIESRPEPGTSLLAYLRRTLLLTGTKEGCGAGACGSCTVMVSKYDVTDKHTSHYTVNACLFPLCAAHGLAITTVEGVGSPNTGLHDVQKRLVESHGLQCGYCTPGFVMSVYTLLRNNPQPTKAALEKALEGNLCRCTGYRPILEAFSSLTHEGCPMGEQCCKNQPDVDGTDTSGAGPDTDTISAGPDRSQVPIFPVELQLHAEQFCRDTVAFTGHQWRWVRPTSVPELLVLKNNHPKAPVIMGNTTALLQMRKGQFAQTDVLLYGGGIPALKSVSVTKDGVVFGAGLTISELARHIKDIAGESGEDKYRPLQAILDMINTFGVDQIRNVATIGGSVLCGRSNSDVITLFAALGVTVNIQSVDGSRTQHIEDVLLGERDVVTSVTVPFSQKNDYCIFYKHSGRRSFSFALVNSGMYIRLSSTNTVERLRICVGGISTKLFVAESTSAAVTGKPWNEATMDDVTRTLTAEMTACVGDSLDTYKVDVVIAFVMKLFAQVSGKLEQSDSLIAPVPSPTSSGVQLYDACTDTDQDPDDALGRPVTNVASEAIVSGEALYLDDIPKCDGELFLSLVLSRRPHANIVKVDPSAALAMEGVHSYIDHTDVMGDNSMGLNNELFALNKVVYVGQPIGAILADTRDVARKATYLVHVEYEDLPSILTLQDAIDNNSYLCDVNRFQTGDMDAAMSQSDHVLEGEYSTGHQEHYYMEPFSALAIPKENKEMEVYVTTQFLIFQQQGLCKLTGIPQNKMHCKVRRIGGGFGGKNTRPLMVCGPAAVAAHKFKRPVRCVLPRDIDMQITGKRHPYMAKYKVGFASNGKLNALDMKFYTNGGCNSETTPGVMSCSADSFENCYKVENINFEGHCCKTNIPSNTALRGFGVPQAVILMEDVIFNVACALNKTPEEIGESNFLVEGDVTQRGRTENFKLPEMWLQCQEQSNYSERQKHVQQFNRDNRWKKRGIALWAGKYGIGTSLNHMMQGTASVNIYCDGSVLVTHGGIEMGQGIYTKMIQIASRALGVPMSKIYTNETGTQTIANPTITAGSLGTDVCGPAVLDACNILSERLQPVRQENPKDTWETLIQKAYMTRVKLQATGFSRKKFDLPKGSPDYMTCGVACTEVEIDVLTGENQVLQADIVMDVGKSLNPAIDIGQIEGAFVQGLGMMTSEHAEVGSDGRFGTCNPVDYKVPNVTSIPRKFNVALLKNHDYVTTCYSSKGVGEPPFILATSVLSAIKDAVMAARKDVGLSGYFQLDCPATVQRIRAACGDQTKAAGKQRVEC